MSDIHDNDLMMEAYKPILTQTISENYCPKCKSRLYPNDEEPIAGAGVCGDCVSWDKTPDKRLQRAVDEYRKKKQGASKKLKMNTKDSAFDVWR